MRIQSATARQQRASARAADIAPTIAELQADGATLLRQIAAGLNAKDISTARGEGTWTAPGEAGVGAAGEMARFRSGSKLGAGGKPPAPQIGRASIFISPWSSQRATQKKFWPVSGLNFCAQLREVDHMIVLGEAHLRRILKSYADYCNGVRTHRSLNKAAPVSRSVQRAGVIRSHPILGGLHHHYGRI
jgi:hypothetical protein